MADDTSKFKLDLDNESFTEKAKEALESINKIGESSESMNALIAGFAEAGVALAGIGVAVFALKEAVDAVFDAEKVKQISFEFDHLTEQAGIYSETLKEGLVEASKGWADDTDLMESANKALLKLESGVEKLPDLMDLARKATLVMGGDVISNFDQITSAVSSGNARALRHLGIVIDQKKAYDTYAKSIRTTADVLSLAGKQQAIMNAALEVSKTKFDDTGEDVKKATNAWLEFKVAISEVKEVIVLAFDKIAGPTVARFFSGMKEMAIDAKNHLKANLGEGAEASAAKIELVKSSIREVKEGIDSLTKDKKEFIISDDEYQIKKAHLEDLLKTYQDQLEKASESDKKFAAERKAREAEIGGGEKASSIDPVAQAVKAAEAQKQLGQIDAQVTAEKIHRMDSLEQAQKLYDAKRLADAAHVQSEIDALHVKGVEDTDQRIVALNQLKDLKMKQNDTELQKFQDQALDNYQRHSTGVFDAIGRSFEAMSNKNKKDLSDFKKLGDIATEQFGSHMVGMFKNIGEEGGSATEKMEKAFLSMIGDIASHYGEMMMLASILPPNPAVFAAGAALVALGGYLGSIAGGGASGGGGPSSGGAEGASGALPTSSLPNSQASTQTQQSKSVQIVVQGHMFSNSESQRWLVDQIRSASDATDFTIASVGGGF